MKTFFKGGILFLSTICAIVLIAMVFIGQSLFKVSFRANIKEKEYLVSRKEFSPNNLYQFRFKPLSLTQGCTAGDIQFYYFLHPDSYDNEELPNPGIKTYLDFVIWAGADFPNTFTLNENVEEGAESLKRGLEYVTARAEQGLRHYQTILAGFFYFFTNIKKKGLYWAEKGAELGETGSMLILGHAYDNGNGIILDRSESWKWYTISSSLGNLAAQGEILAGSFCDNGPTIEEKNQGKQKATAWMKKHKNFFISNN